MNKALDPAFEAKIIIYMRKRLGSLQFKRSDAKKEFKDAEHKLKMLDNEIASIEEVINYYELER